MGKENLLTERDLLVLTACTSIMFAKDWGKVRKFISDTLDTSLFNYEFALQDTFDKCREILKDDFAKVLSKMHTQAQETV